MLNSSQNGKVYAAHEAAFRDTSAYIVLDQAGSLVARVAFKFAKSGLRTTCYFHIMGVPMVRGTANGGGYDKATAAAWSALNRNSTAILDAQWRLWDVIKDQGLCWRRDLEDAGFIVHQAL